MDTRGRLQFGVGPPVAPTWRYTMGSQKTRAHGTDSTWLTLCGTVAMKDEPLRSQER